MIELIGLLVALFVLMAASLWLTSVFKIPIQVDSKRNSRFSSSDPDLVQDGASALARELVNDRTDLSRAAVLVDLSRFKGSTLSKPDANDSRNGKLVNKRDSVAVSDDAGSKPHKRNFKSSFKDEPV